MSIAEGVVSAFSGMGVIWVFAGLFLVIFIDAVIFPMLPEVAILLAYAIAAGSIPGVPLSGCILVVVILGEVSGTSLLYFLASHARLPPIIKKGMNRYVDIFFIRDERLILLNRAVPVLPVLGAFIAIRGWNFPKSITYVVAGCIVKYGLILMFITWSAWFYHSSLSFYVSLAAVGILISLSLLGSYMLRRRARTKHS